MSTAKASIDTDNSRLTSGDNRQNESNNRLIDNKAFVDKADLPQVTIRASLVGLLIGSVVLISNFQFGLQTGWVSMMSLPSALLGFALFKLSPYAKDFTDVENVYIQSTAVAVGTGPLAYGLIGIIPAIEKFMTADETGIGRQIRFTTLELMIWSLGLALFGVFFAVPLRKQVIVKEKLPFPSGSATATLISVLHGTELIDNDSVIENEIIRDEEHTPLTNAIHTEEEFSTLSNTDTYNSNLKSLTLTFIVSAFYTLLAFFFPILKSLPIFGNYLSANYKWNFQPSPAYIGQGIIMGLPTVSYMLFGAILGWGILAPLSKYKGWAPGEIGDWIEGGQGWILWISLSIMISDSLISFLVVSFKTIYSSIKKDNISINEASEYQSLITNSAETTSVNKNLVNGNHLDSEKDLASRHNLSNRFSIIGVILSSILCIISIRAIFHTLVPYYAIICAIILALLFSILGVRALGETDLNPVSGIGKLSQLIFAVIIPANHPSKILINLIAGGISEAGAQQAGDLMQDLKTGHLIGASPRAQFIAQLMGTVYSVFLSSIMYRVYTMVYEIPSEDFRIPTAVVWIDCSRLVTGEGLPPRVFEFAMGFGILFGIISLLKNTVPKHNRYHKYLVYLPNGVAVGIGIYNSPNFTLARFLGGVIAYWWMKKNAPSDHNSKISIIIFSSGLVLGEGLLSGFTMLLTSLGVKNY